MLPCLSADEDDGYNRRSWYDGWFDQAPKGHLILFKQNKRGKIVTCNGSPDMTVNKDNFSLVISSAKLTNNKTYTCYVYTNRRKKTWDYIDLQIYSEYESIS